MPLSKMSVLSNTPEQEVKLCSVCRGATEAKFLWVGIRKLREVAAEEGCVSCKLQSCLAESVLTAAELEMAAFRCKKREGSLWEDEVYQISVPSAVRGVSDELKYVFLGGVNRLHSIRQLSQITSTLHFRGSVGALNKYFLSRRHLPGATHSELTFEAIRRRLLFCREHHPKCGRAVGSSPFPRRVLDLRNGQIVLCEHPGPSRRADAPYACLSHCWGEPGSVPKTTKENIALYKSGIPPGDLSPTFLDAADACRRLRIDFLWIDSLCIVQGDLADWARESASMADTYENAAVTIAATASAGGAGGGGLYRRTPARCMSRAVRDHPGLFARQLMPPMISGEAAGPWPLLSRAWVYQEMRLSRRVLHFTREEVVVQCWSERWSESGSHDNDYSGTLASWLSQRHHTDELRAHWWVAVSEYSELDLTFPGDRLPALAALARRMAEARGDDRYLAGLWQRTLVADLGWVTRSYHRRSERGREQPAASAPQTTPPTWSWAAVDAPVRWDPRTTSLAEIVTVVALDCESVGPVGLGLLRAGSSITLRGPSLESALRANSEPEFAVPELASEMGTRSGRFEGDSGWVSHVGPAGTSLYFVPLSRSVVLSGPQFVSGLVLKRGRGPNTFERLGLYTCTWKLDGHEEPSIPWRRALQSWLQSLPVDEFVLV